MNIKTDRIAIVAVGYNRPQAMKRLLYSIISADYCGDPVDLVISIDKGELQRDIKEIADAIDWAYGDKYVRVYEERLGLKKHILSCGDLTEDYKAVVVLEDDLTVSSLFYSYVKSAVNFYKNEGYIAGISLYGYQIIPYSSRHFIPDNNGYDAYFMQIAMSWGQCWTKDMWSGFKEWFNTHSFDIPNDGLLPEAVINWGDKSWLKYYDRYLVESNKFFIMPYVSLSTNHTEIGEHANCSTTMFEVPMLKGNRVFCFPLINDAVIYDAFFERSDLDFCDILGLKSRVMIDLNGIKPKLMNNSDYIVSTKSWPYRCVCEYGLQLRPIEENLIKRTPGKGIYVYDTKVVDKRPAKKLNFDKYDLYDATWRQTLMYSIGSIVQRLRFKLLRK